jgi:hypothetical protein
VNPSLAIGASVAAIAAGGPAAASVRGEAIATAFRSWCLSSPPSYAALDAKATAAGLAVQNHSQTATPPEGQLETKEWTLSSDPTGPFTLSAGQATSRAKTVSMCEVDAEDVIGDDLLAVLSRPDRLGAQTAARTSDDGGARLTEFKAPFAGATILLTDGSPQHAAGVMLNITQVREPGR